MPMSYGGGIRSVQDAAPVLAAGVEKVIVGRAAAEAASIRELADSFGSQAVAACIDCRRVSEGWRVAHDRGQILAPTDPVTLAKMVEQSGAGEILLQSIDRDGERKGYDCELIAKVSAAVDLPLVALGGAGNLQHLIEGIGAGASAAASGSAFVFIGRLRAVLLTYPSRGELELLQSMSAQR